MKIHSKFEKSLSHTSRLENFLLIKYMCLSDVWKQIENTFVFLLTSSFAKDIPET